MLRLKLWDSLTDAMLNGCMTAVYVSFYFYHYNSWPYCTEILSPSGSVVIFEDIDVAMTNSAKVIHRNDDNDNSLRASTRTLDKEDSVAEKSDYRVAAPGSSITLSGLLNAIVGVLDSFSIRLLHMSLCRMEWLDLRDEFVSVPSIPVKHSRAHMSTSQKCLWLRESESNIPSFVGPLIDPLIRNNKAKLDPALIRPGRVDVSFEFKNANRAVSREIFKVFYPVTGKFPITHGEPGELQGTESLLRADAESTSSTCFVNDLAEKFAAAIPEGEFSPAELQGEWISYCSMNINAYPSFWFSQVFYWRIRLALNGRLTVCTPGYSEVESQLPSPRGMQTWKNESLLPTALTCLLKRFSQGSDDTRPCW
jgi:hypothetical protein